MKMKLRVYIDTSVIGGCCDDGFKEWSFRLIKEFKVGLHIPVISEITLAEMNRAPREVQDILVGLMDYDCEAVSETVESETSEKVIKFHKMSC